MSAFMIYQPKRPTGSRMHSSQTRPVLPFFILAVFGLSCGLFVGCSPTADAPQAAEGQSEIPQMQAEVFAVTAVKWPWKVRVQGSLYADELAAIGARVSGRVAAVHADIGDEVRQGQPLVTLENDEFELLVAQAKAQLAQARSAVGLSARSLSASGGQVEGAELAEGALPHSRREGVLEDLIDPLQSPLVRRYQAIWEEAKSSLERGERMREQDAISASEFELLSSAERVAEAQYAAAIHEVEEKLASISVRRVVLALAQQKYEDTVIRAPFDGVVQLRRTAPGAFVNVGDPVISVVRTDPIWFRGTVPERYAGRVQTGQQVSIQLEGASQPLVASVTRISPSLDMSTRSLTFEARLDNPDRQLRGGLFAKADLFLDEAATSLAVPATAVSQFAGEQKVWQLTDGITAQRDVEIGEERDGFVQILDGLSKGDTVLVDAGVGQIAKILQPAEPIEVAYDLEPKSKSTSTSKVEGFAGLPQAP